MGPLMSVILVILKYFYLVNASKNILQGKV